MPMAIAGQLRSESALFLDSALTFLDSVLNETEFR